MTLPVNRMTMSSWAARWILDLARRGIPIGLRTRSAPESCKARWLWLKNARPDLITRTDNDA